MQKHLTFYELDLGVNNVVRETEQAGSRDAGVTVERGLNQQCGFGLRDAGVVVSGGALGGGVHGSCPPCILTDVHSLAPHNVPRLAFALLRTFLVSSIALYPQALIYLSPCTVLF